jgi:hypothetical protein
MMPFFRARRSKPDVVVEVVFVDPDSSVESVTFFLPILSRRARFLRVNRARFIKGSASLSLSICRFRGGVVWGACSSCEQVRGSSMVKGSCGVKEDGWDFYVQARSIKWAGREPRWPLAAGSGCK